MNTRSRSKSKARKTDKGWTTDKVIHIRKVKKLLCSLGNRIKSEKNFNNIIIGLFCVLYIHVPNMFILYLEIHPATREGQRWCSGKALRLRNKRSGVRFPVSPLRFHRLVISYFQVAIWMKYRWSDANPQNNQPTLIRELEKCITPWIPLIKMSLQAYCILYDNKQSKGHQSGYLILQVNNLLSR